MDLVFLDSPIGRLGLMGEGEKLVRLSLPGYPVPLISPRTSPVLKETARQLEAYFAGKLQVFDLPLYTGGTPFRQKVWAQLQEIPYGEVISYGELARRIGQPTACRAVGGANHHNPIPIIIPCHRVIAAGPSLGGYGGGKQIKRALLSLEGVTF